MMFHRRSWLQASWGCLSALSAILTGCHWPPPGGNVIEPRPLGSVLDEVNQQQEVSADLAKFIIYMHEFEINLQPDPTKSMGDKATNQGFHYQPPPRIYGVRLTPAGQDHVRQISWHLQHDTTQDPQRGHAGILVVVERSDTSKRWDTQHRYPVHLNDELDTLRRQMVVEALQGLGIGYADEIVVVAPASPTGLNAEEAAIGYYNTFGNSNSPGNRSGRSGGWR